MVGRGLRLRLRRLTADGARANGLTVEPRSRTSGGGCRGEVGDT